MPLTVGGGVRTLEDIRALLLAGADKVSINTAAVHRPEFVREAAGKLAANVLSPRSMRKRPAMALRSSPMAAASPPASTPSRMPASWWIMAYVMYDAYTVSWIFSHCLVMSARNEAMPPDILTLEGPSPTVPLTWCNHTFLCSECN